MALDPVVKKNWIELQKRFDYPVNALGMRIDPKDDFTMNVWKTEGIDSHMQRNSE